MLKVKSTPELTKGPFANLDLTLGNTGLVFICGKKESSSIELQKIIAGVTFNPNIIVSLDDEEIDDELKLNNYRLNNVGFVFGNSQLIEKDTVLYNTIISTVTYSQDVTEEKVDEVLEFTNLLDKKDVLVEDLTEFEKHRLDIARALLKEPKIIYANNPVARLNEDEANAIWMMLKEISKTCLVIAGNAVIKVAEKYADQIIAFSNHSAEGNEVIEITNLNEVESTKPQNVTKKNNTFSFNKCFNISLCLLKNKIIVMVLFILTLSIFLYGSAIKNDSYLKFAKALKEENINTAYVERQNDRDNLDASINSEQQKNLENIADDLTVRWSNYFSKVPGKPLKTIEVHFTSIETDYRYPDSLFLIEETELANINLLYGTKEASNEGVYLSRAEATEYLDYFNKFVGKFDSYAMKSFKAEYLKVYPDTTPEIINNIEDLVGKYTFYPESVSEAFRVGKNANELNKYFKVVGIYDDNQYDGRMFLSKNYQFSEHFNIERFYSLGVVSLSNSIESNAELIETYASIIRNEKEVIKITTALDDKYNELYATINKVPGAANLVALVLLILTICGSAIMSFLLVSTYRDEIVLARTYGLEPKETYKVSLLTNLIVSLVSTIASVIIVLIASLITNSIIKNNYSFVTFNYVAIPLYGYLVALLALVVLTIVFTIISIKTLKKKDYIVF